MVNDDIDDVRFMNRLYYLGKGLITLKKNHNILTTDPITWLLNVKSHKHVIVTNP